MFLDDIKFSLWADFIEREFLDKEFKELIDKGIINGATSNPAIFKNAILTSKAYQKQLNELSGIKAKEKYEELAIYDIKKAADILYPLYKNGDDGFVSIEVDPNFAYNSKETIKEAKRLWNKIDRENLMIKIPVTKDGIVAIKELVREGININATLIFDPEYARMCLDAFEEGVKSGNKRIYGVLSIFISRFDRKLDEILVKKGVERGKVGILNGAKIYNLIQKRDLPNIRALFASTGVKSSDYKPYYYISELIAPKSINTAPIETIRSFVKSGSKTQRLPIKDKIIENFFKKIEDVGIDMQQVYDELLSEGLKAFVDAFDDILKELE